MNVKASELARRRYLQRVCRGSEIVGPVDVEPRELMALNAVVRALSPLDAEARRRVLLYVIDYFQIGGLER